MGVGGGFNFVVFRYVIDFFFCGWVNYGEGFVVDRFYKFIVDKDLKELKREINVVIKY